MPELVIITHVLNITSRFACILTGRVKANPGPGPGTDLNGVPLGLVLRGLSLPYKATASTLYFHTGYEDEFIRERLFSQTLKLLPVQDRDRSRCLLCGAQDLVVSHRVVAEHDGVETNVRMHHILFATVYRRTEADVRTALGPQPILWLTGHKLLPAQHEENGLSSLMTRT
ncbi:hypothetical protein C2E23DRAFT_852402 [Lenzites betulinus]|nr:hypothetical protein C2E23DRAFT_852402 [Lenzites betulinus]